MRKVKTFKEGRYEIQEAIEEWLKKHPDYNIVSISGVSYTDYEILTYVLYEERNGLSLNS